MTQVMSSPTTTEVPKFTPSPGLRYWMNRMKRTNSTTAQDNNDKISSKSATTNGLYARSLNDTTSAVSVSGTTTHSFFGVDSLHAHDIDSSLRVLHHHAGGCASSERSSFMSDDIQSNASIKSKPWVSQLLSTNDSHAASAQSIDPPNLVLTHQGDTHLLVEQNKRYDEDDDDDDEDDDNDDDDYIGADGDILYSTTTSSSYSAAYHSSLHSIRSAEDIQPATAINDEEDGYSSPQQPQQQQQQLQQQQQQQQQQQRRWSDHQYPPSPPRPLGRIKAGLGRLMGREHATSTMEQRGSLT